jgi:hypothetical protein
VSIRRAPSNTAIADRHVGVLTTPVFIVGAPRSGTTWLQRLLLCHPKVCGGNESHFFKSFGLVLRNFDHESQSRRGTGLPGYWSREDLVEEIHSLWCRTMSRVVATTADAELLLEKSPPHAMFIPEIVSVFPRARFVHLIRDPRAVVASLLAASREEWGEFWAPRSVDAAARIWRDHVAAACRDGRRLGERAYMEIRYEQLHAQTMNELRRVLEFLGLRASEDQLSDWVHSQSFEEQRRTGGTVLKNFAVPGERPESTEPLGFFRKGQPDAWRKELSFFQRRRIRKICGGVMRERNYE